mgnify:CR=1 FL=1
MQAIVKRIGREGISFVGRADSGHWVPMDTAPDQGGQNASATPLELLLIALGGCTSMDVLAILAKKRIRLDDYEVALDGDRSPTHPKVFTTIRVTYRFYGEGLSLTDLEQAVRLSAEKYCSVMAMVARAAVVSHGIEVHPPRTAP